ncbi:hypothetical protein B0T24DRAFT_411701 [Lasiosphaeria ovina]|uniref:Uncharacterized protein n=1 Tax=Lasiosphaeria ovina TaxID=92902 RepID=A0AAE0JXA7_9PEZI|nr:hypothetical protein B0T24DRAFT_411701 [Lasiosphaeria ovina]
MSTISRPTHIACVEDADESGNPIEKTARYAASSYAASVVSPTKEKSNTSRTRREYPRRDSSSPITSGLTDSDSTLHPRGDSLRKATKDRNRSDSNKKVIMASKARPPVKHSKTTPSLPRRDAEATYYGVNPTVTAASSRPRAQTSNPRPSSYYGGASRPPLANARYHYNSYQQPPTLPTSYPPSNGWAGPVPYPPPSPSPVVMQQPPELFTRTLPERFSTARPASAMGFRPPLQVEYDAYDDVVDRKPLTRRPSTHRKGSRNDDDMRTMPPPRRPASARPTALAIRPPPPTPAPYRPSNVFDDDDYITPDHALFHDISPRQKSEFPAPILKVRSRRPSIGASYRTYDSGDFRTEVAGRNSRRNSYYANQSASSGSGYEDKLHQASIYQDHVTGGPAMPLTAETLRKAGKNGGSSRSTRSSGSRDESEYRESATTRTTRSSANDEDVTIRVKGSTVLKVGGAEMQCRDGAEINIISRGPTPFRSSSDQSSYMGHEDRRTRIERPPTRTRTNSQAGSYSRALPGGYDRYSMIPPYPAYPTYPTTEGFF